MEEVREAGFKQKTVLIRIEALALESERPKFKFVLLCCQIGDGFRISFTSRRDYDKSNSNNSLIAR